MTSWTRWSKGLLTCGMTTMMVTGCLEEDPNMDGVMTATSTDGGNTGSATSNGPGGTMDDTGPGPTGGSETDQPPPMGTTIYDIQTGNVAEGAIVTLEDVVVVSPVQVNDGGVFVQEPDGGINSGIFVYLFADVVAGVPLAPGDVVTLTAEYSEFFDESQLAVMGVGDISVTGTGTIPDPIAVSTSDIVAGAASAEDYEGVPICVSGVEATDATNMFGDFHIDDNAAVTNFFLFDSDDFLDVLPGTQFASLCGPMRYTFEEYKIAPRSGADYDADLVGCTDAAPVVSIGEIQMESFNTGDLVQVVDAVVTTPWNFDEDVFWVQDPAGGAYSGIAVYMPDSGGYAPTPGDVVTVCGEYDEFFDQSQIQVQASGVTASGNGPVPAPEVLTPDVVGGGPMAEMWEGVLVEVQGVTVTAEVDMFGQWQVDDALLLIPEFLGMGAWPNPALDTVYTSITGVMTFSFEEYKLAPRFASDLVE